MKKGTNALLCKFQDRSCMAHGIIWSNLEMFHHMDAVMQGVCVCVCLFWIW